MSTDVNENKRLISIVQKLMKIKGLIENPRRRPATSGGASLKVDLCAAGAVLICNVRRRD
jgi:hypothetical protein